MPTEETKDECVICHEELPSGEHLCRKCEDKLDQEFIESVDN